MKYVFEKKKPKALYLWIILRQCVCLGQAKVGGGFASQK